MKIICSDTKEICSSYKEYLKSQHWSKFKNLYYYQVSKECKICGKKYNLNLHHFDYKSLGKEKFGDVIMLCGTCHNLMHEMYGKETKEKLKNKYSKSEAKKRKAKPNKPKKKNNKITKSQRLKNYKEGLKDRTLMY